MTATSLAHELDRLEAEISLIEKRIAAGRGGIVDHILLVATQRTHATTQQALNEHQFGRSTLPGIAPLEGLESFAPEPRASSPSVRAHSGTQRRSTTDFWVSGTTDTARSAATWRPLRAVGGTR